MEVVGVLFPRWQLTFFQRHILIMVLLQIKHIPGRGTEQKLSAFEGPWLHLRPILTQEIN